MEYRQYVVLCMKDCVLASVFASSASQEVGSMSRRRAH